MMSSHDQAGGRKYLTEDERRRFLAAADAAPRDVRAFCRTVRGIHGPPSFKSEMVRGRYGFHTNTQPSPGTPASHILF